MANICPDCQKEFYSDTEFEQHQFMEIVKKAVAKQGDGLQGLGGQIDRLGTIIMQKEVIRISEQRGITIEDAAAIWFDLEGRARVKFRALYTAWQKEEEKKVLPQ